MASRCDQFGAICQSPQIRLGIARSDHQPLLMCGCSYSSSFCSGLTVFCSRAYCRIGAIWPPWESKF